MTAAEAYTLEWEVEGFYAGAWEGVYTGENKADALARRDEYRDNEPGTAFRVKGHRIPVVFGSV